MTKFREGKGKKEEERTERRAAGTPMGIVQFAVQEGS